MYIVARGDVGGQEPGVRSSLWVPSSVKLASNFYDKSWQARRFHRDVRDAMSTCPRKRTKGESEATKVARQHRERDPSFFRRGLDEGANLQLIFLTLRKGTSLAANLAK